MSPNEMRALKVAAGKDLKDMDEAENVQFMGWLRLRRMGYAVSWEQAGDMEVRFVEPDPTNST